MARLHNPQHNYKLAVDNVTIYENEIELDCSTVGMSNDEEPESFTRTLRLEVLKDHVCENGKVDVTHILSPDDEMEIDFDRWLDDVSYSELERICAEIINKVEGRTVIYEQPINVVAKQFGDLSNIFGNITSQIRSICHQ